MQTEFERQVREADERLPQRTGRPLISAIAIGLGLGGLLLVSLLILKALFMVFVAVLIGFAIWELATALRTAGRDVPRVASIASAGVAIIPHRSTGWMPGHWLITLAAIAFVALWRIAELVRPQPTARPGAGERARWTSGRARSCSSTSPSSARSPCC